MSSPYKSFVALLRALGLVEGSYKPFPGGTLTHNGTGAGAISYYNATTYPLMDNVVTSTNAQCSVVPYDAPPLGNQAFWSYDPTAAAVYRYRRQQSVNLGSWFVQEDWMVASLFACASGPRTAEIDIASGWGSLDNARAMLERHWDTFINQTDFDYLANIGINTVRIPIGYWTLGPPFLTGTPFEPYTSVYMNAFPRFVRAINMAAQSGIGVLVDLHGAIGSQNGQPHSGISDGRARLFNNDSAYMDKTVDLLVYLAGQLQNVTNVVGIEILNEPVDVPALWDFYTRAIMAMRAAGYSLPLYIHDGFNLEQFGTYISGRTDFVVEDHHSYFVFTPADESEPASQHTNDVQGSIASEFSAVDSKDRDNLVIGEWSCALTPQSLASQVDPNAARRRFCSAQMGVYANTSGGWSFWSYTKEGCDTDPGWCFKAAVGKSLPDTFFSYGKPPPADYAELQRIYGAVADMTVPAQADILKMLESTWASLAVTRGNNSPVAWNVTSPQQRQASIRGYSDGYQTAKVFTQHGWSRLGFEEQYVRDSIGAVPGAVPEIEDYYRNGFKTGLADGEGVVFALLS